MHAERRRIQVTGTVQGVGFRPFVYRTAVSLGLTGNVANDGRGVTIEAQGPRSAVEELCRRLRLEPPPLAVVDRVESGVAVPVEGESTFAIVATAMVDRPEVPVSVDVGPCADCLTEVRTRRDRRYAYPFVNCTNCGPRYTIVQSVPYDRLNTTMRAFAMCGACRAEYEDPADRRFHAQPNACRQCGPRVQLWDVRGAILAKDGPALDAAVTRLCAGEVIALKGVGGYHLAVDATRDEAVAELRRRKARDDKPFALMVRSVAAARQLCEFDREGEAALVSLRRPIVLAPRRPGAAVAEHVASGLDELGLMLPPSPLHQLLADTSVRPLVMTSGNLSDEPIAYTEDDALARLGAVADALLVHDRPIQIRCDDSVVRARPGRGVQMVRRSRGYVPEPMRLPVAARHPVLAVGAEMKNTIALARDAWVMPSHHLGDLEQWPAYRSFVEAVDHLCHLCGEQPRVVAHDQHPEYLSTKFALDLDWPAVPVQHHHAHVASCLVDHGRTGPVVGVAYDGLGYGDDGTLWGGEILVADLRGYERAGHLRSAAMPGGVAAIREPWRMAVSWVLEALGAEALDAIGGRLDPRAPEVAALASRVETLHTTSVGRLFDAVAALLHVRTRVTYEGQAAIELEARARALRGAPPVYPVDVVDDVGSLVIDPRPLIACVVEESGQGTPTSVLAAGFHAGLADATARAAAEVASARALGTVVLTGGVFQNTYLTALVSEQLEGSGLEVLVHRDIAPNDGGISIGQAAVAAARSNES